MNPMANQTTQTAEMLPPEMRPITGKVRLRGMDAAYLIGKSITINSTEGKLTGVVTKCDMNGNFEGVLK